MLAILSAICSCSSECKILSTDPELSSFENGVDLDQKPSDQDPHCFPFRLKITCLQVECCWLTLCLLLLITFANSLYPDQARQNIGPDKGPMESLKEFFEKVDFEKNQQTTKIHAKLPSNRFFFVCFFFFLGGGGGV